MHNTIFGCEIILYGSVVEDKWLFIYYLNYFCKYICIGWLYIELCMPQEVNFIISKFKKTTIVLGNNSKNNINKY